MGRVERSHQMRVEHECLINYAREAATEVLPWRISEMYLYGLGLTFYRGTVASRGLEFNRRDAREFAGEFVTYYRMRKENQLCESLTVNTPLRTQSR